MTCLNCTKTRSCSWNHFTGSTKNKEWIKLQLRWQPSFWSPWLRSVIVKRLSTVTPARERSPNLQGNTMAVITRSIAHNNRRWHVTACALRLFNSTQVSQKLHKHTTYIIYAIIHYRNGIPRHQITIADSLIIVQSHQSPYQTVSDIYLENICTPSYYAKCS